MVTCHTCGGVEFNTYDGFMYCVVCQTQSQDIHEQEHDKQEFAIQNTIKIVQKKEKEKKKTDDGGVWTSWEAFNYILYGMTQEIKCSFSLSSEFESLVLKLWACYLKQCKAGFVSRFSEVLPKLQFNFKQRDARILYNIDEKNFSEKNWRKRSKSISSVFSDNSSFMNIRTLRRKKSKIIARDYEEHVSTSLSNTSLSFATLESLGKDSGNSFASGDETDSSASVAKSIKQMFSSKDYKTYKNSLYSNKLRVKAKEFSKQSVKSLSKTKLLSIIHLALLMSGNEIQLSDLLRFIREGHLSYSKVTHFLPKEFQFSKNDFCYIDVVSDSGMPTHLSQRKISSKLAYLLKIEKIKTPDMYLLVERYCNELNLPDQVALLSKKIVTKWVPKLTVPKAKGILPSFEAWAMVSIIFIMKLLFGLNDKSEIFLSDLAKNVNRVKNDEERLFVFEDWQKFIEFRKVILMEHHYPTQEQLRGNAVVSSKKFLNTLRAESKDDHRNERFIPYQRYYLSEKLMTLIRGTIELFTKPVSADEMSFEPSLTPQISHINAIAKKMAQKQKGENEDEIDDAEYEAFRKILQQNFKNSHVEFAYEPEIQLKLLKAKNEGDTANLRFYAGPESQQDILSPSAKYWILHYSDSESGILTYFREKVFLKMPRNFQWLMTECARMLEMNIRDVYDELILLECDLINGNNLNFQRVVI